MILAPIRPRYLTRADVRAGDDSAAGHFIAHLHQRRWLDWQAQAGRLIGRRNAAGTGYAFHVVVILVPRQCGKTTFVFDVAQARCLEYPDYRAAYCAQTGHVTSERFIERIGETGGTVLGAIMRGRRSAGTERMNFPRGSFLKAFPPKDGALRGSALDLVAVDEAQEISEDLGRALDLTILPTFTTRPRRQLVLIGTAGTNDSQYLARYLDMARAGHDGIACLEYGATPPVDDPGDERLWSAVHPGLAAGLTDAGALRAARLVMGDAGFTREYLNVWTTTTEQIIPHEVWAAAAAPLASPGPGARLTFGVDVGIDRTHGAIVACWADTNHRPTLELIDYAPGVSWIAPRLAVLVSRHRPAAVLAESGGPVATVVDDAARAGLSIATLPARDYAAACAAMYDDLLEAAIQHRGDAALDLAAAGTARRPTGDAWCWGRRSSANDISPLIAATLARWAFLHPVPIVPNPKPLVAAG